MGSAVVNDHPSQGEEQWNRENVQGYDPKTGTGVLGRAAGVKTAKLCMEQDQIGKRQPSVTRARLPGKIARFTKVIS